MNEWADTTEGPGSASNAWFFRETALDDLLAGLSFPPIESVDERALGDLTPEEATSFLSSIDE